MRTEKQRSNRTGYLGVLCLDGSDAESPLGVEHCFTAKSSCYINRADIFIWDGSLHKHVYASLMASLGSVYRSFYTCRFTCCPAQFWKVWRQLYCSVGFRDIQWNLLPCNWTVIDERGYGIAAGPRDLQVLWTMGADWSTSCFSACASLPQTNFILHIRTQTYKHKHTNTTSRHEKIYASRA